MPMPTLTIVLFIQSIPTHALESFKPHFPCVCLQNSPGITVFSVFQKYFVHVTKITFITVYRLQNKATASTGQALSNMSSTMLCALPAALPHLHLPATLSCKHYWWSISFVSSRLWALTIHEPYMPYSSPLHQHLMQELAHISGSAHLDLFNCTAGSLSQKVLLSTLANDGIKVFPKVKLKACAVWFVSSLGVKSKCVWAWRVMDHSAAQLLEDHHTAHNDPERTACKANAMSGADFCYSICKPLECLAGHPSLTDDSVLKPTRE